MPACFRLFATGVVKTPVTVLLPVVLLASIFTFGGQQVRSVDPFRDLTHSKTLCDQITMSASTSRSLRRAIFRLLTLLLLVGRARSDLNETPSKPDRFFQGGIESVDSIRCPSHMKELYVRNETGGFVELTSANDLAKGGEEQEYFHPCWCTDYYHRPVEYCPSSTPICVVHGRDGPVECLSHSSAATISELIWPTGFFYLAFVLLVWILTKKGGYTYHYVRRKLFHRNAEEECLIEEANRLLAQGGRPVLLNEEFVRRERERMRAQSTATPKPKRKKIKKPVALKTKSFSIPTSSDASDHQDDEDDYECAICLGTLENGDVVGDIPCGHLFHKDCLKTWVKRKTRCPLCQDKGLVCSPSNDKDEKETQVPSSGRTLGMTDSDTTSDADLEAPSDPDVETPSEHDMETTLNAEDRV